MTIEELIEKLQAIAKLESQGGNDIEANHVNADKLLLEFINNPEVERIYNSFEKWYA